MHVIVGQGQLDEVLNAGPDARRALIEEAAGVLKHRRRKEKAVRKLDAMQANLTRLVDLTGELGRRLKPLGRQAEIARRAAVIQADLRDARLRLLADDYVTLAAELARDETDEAASAQARAALETRASAGAGTRGARWSWPNSSTRRGWRRRRTRSSRCPAWPSGCAGVLAWPPSGTGTCLRPSRSGPAATPRSWSAEAAELRAQERELAERLPRPGSS